MASTSAVQKPAVNVAAAFAVLDDLMRLVVRGFYDDEQVLATEVLLRVHRPISDDEIAATLKLHFRQVRRALSKLKEDQLVNSIDKKDKDKSNKDREEKERKWNQLTYWYIDYKHMVDVVKYRIYMMTKALGSELDKQLECQDYHCPTCRKEYTAFDAQKLIDFETGSFRCERCKSELQEKDNSAQVGNSQKKQSLMLTQLRTITDQLKKTEGIIIPVLDLKIAKAEEGGEVTAVSNARPIYEPTVVVDFGGEKMEKGKNEVSPAIFVKTESVKASVPWLSTNQKEKQPEFEIPVETTTTTTANPAVKDEDVNYAQSYYQQMLAQQAQQAPVEAEETEEAPMEGVGDDVKVKVGDRLISINEVTTEDESQMTPEEYQEYYQKMKDLGWVQE